MHFFQRLCTTIETCWIESINLGYNARFFATLTKIDKYIKFNNEVEKHTWSRNKNLMDTSLWEGNLLQYAWYTSAVLEHVKLLGLAEQNHGYPTSLHRIRSDKISDKEGEYENSRLLKWPLCCDVTWISNLITILDCRRPDQYWLLLWSLAFLT